MEETHIAHVRRTDLKVQTNEEHSLGVANLAELFASDFGMGKWGRVLGLLHDKGKEQNSFQKYIRKITGLDPNIDWNGKNKCQDYNVATHAGA